MVIHRGMIECGVSAAAAASRRIQRCLRGCICWVHWVTVSQDSGRYRVGWTVSMSAPRLIVQWWVAQQSVRYRRWWPLRTPS
jgi:hypothetical protein